MFSAVRGIPNPAATALYADAAQIVPSFQNASGHAKFQKFYYPDDATASVHQPNNYFPNGHFRHAQKANVTFADGHVDGARPVADAMDQRLPNQFTGQLPPEVLRVP